MTMQEQIIQVMKGENRMKKLENRVAVITGGSRGIGKGIALTFAKEGADIVFSYHSNAKAADETVRD